MDVSDNFPNFALYNASYYRKGAKAMIEKSTIQRIMEATDIVEVISESVALRKAGTSFKGKCPFHDDTTPSFYVNPVWGTYKCFGCGESGDAASFLMKHNGLSYPEAMRWLADKYGITINEEQPMTDRTEASMLRANEWAAAYFSGNLETEAGKTGKDYLAGRGFTDDTIREFGLGYALQDRSSMSIAAVKQRISRSTLQKTGLAYKGTDTDLVYDRFAGRVIFPWKNISGRVVGLAGRKLDAETKGVEQKYINSCDSAVFSKSNELYGIYQAKAAIRIANNAYIVEGYTDVISLHQAGVKNVVGCSGTALTANHARLLKRCCNNVTLMFDGDEAGLKAAVHNIEPLLAEGMNVRVVTLADNEDPDTLAKRMKGEELLAYLKANAVDFMDFYGLHIVDKENYIPDKAVAIKNLLKLTDMIPDEVTRTLYQAECKKRYLSV